MYSLESYDADRSLRKMSAPESIGALDEKRWMGITDRPEGVRHGSTKQPGTRYAYDIRNYWARVSRSA